MKHGKYGDCRCMKSLVKVVTQKYFSKIIDNKKYLLVFHNLRACQHDLRLLRI